MTRFIKGSIEVILTNNYSKKMKCPTYAAGSPSSGLPYSNIDVVVKN